MGEGGAGRTQGPRNGAVARESRRSLSLLKTDKGSGCAFVAHRKSGAPVFQTLLINSRRLGKQRHRGYTEEKGERERFGRKYQVKWKLSSIIVPRTIPKRDGRGFSFETRDGVKEVSNRIEIRERSCRDVNENDRIRSADEKTRSVY